MRLGIFKGLAGNKPTETSLKEILLGTIFEQIVLRRLLADAFEDFDRRVESLMCCAEWAAILRLQVLELEF